MDKQHEDNHAVSVLVTLKALNKAVERKLYIGSKKQKITEVSKVRHNSAAGSWSYARSKRQEPLP